MNADRTARIQGLNKFSGLLTHLRREATRSQKGTNRLLIVSDSGDQFEIRLNEQQDNPVFVGKIISAFRFNPLWREHFRVFTHAHEATELLYADGSAGLVDLSLKPYVQELNNQGFRTTESCEGDSHPMGRVPSITFADTMPAALETAWTALGWINMDRSVCPIACHGYTMLFRQMFFTLLDDWQFGSVDISAQRYRVDRVAKPLIPELPAVNDHALNDHQSVVTKRVKRINSKGAEATFDDLVKLRCGRDRYSTMKLPALRESLINDPGLDFIEARIYDTPALQRALRWKLRGLDLTMVLRKHEVDQVLESIALVRKKARLAKRTGD